jgi:hypothetical protein
MPENVECLHEFGKPQCQFEYQLAFLLSRRGGQFMRQLLSLSLLTIGVAGLALGQISPVPIHKAPEINPGQAISALALLFGGLLIVRRKK